MIRESPYTKREQDASIKMITDHLEKQDITLEKILDQTSKTNGRVTTLEAKTSDYPEVKKQLNDVSTWKTEFMAEIRGMKRVLIIVVIGLPALISTIFFLYIGNFKQEVIQESSQAVLSSLEEKY